MYTRERMSNVYTVFARAFIPFNPLSHKPYKTFMFRTFEIIVGEGENAPILYMYENHRQFSYI